MNKGYEEGLRNYNSERLEEMEARKGLFLRALEEWGTIKKACELTGIARITYKRWHSQDFDFARDVSESRTTFAESLEELALDRVKNPDKNRGSDVLLIGLLNANMPQKYRPQVSMNEDSAKELIIEWRKATQAVKASVPTGETELPVPVERTLAEILEKRGSSKKGGGVGDQEET
jgi:hypothetical protein